MKEKTSKKKNLAEEYLNDLKRIQAEFENYQKRIEQEKLIQQRRESLDSKQDLILKLIEILDNFERAVSNKNNNEEFQEGINLIHKQLKETLEKESVKQIKEDYFDPNIHEVISTEEGEENKILEEFQKGYTLHDKTIRTSKVKVGKGGNKNESKPDSDKKQAQGMV